MKTLAVSPDPISIPGELTATASGSTAVELTAPLSVSVCILPLSGSRNSSWCHHSYLFQPPQTTVLWNVLWVGGMCLNLQLILWTSCYLYGPISKQQQKQWKFTRQGLVRWMWLIQTHYSNVTIKGVSVKFQPTAPSPPKGCVFSSALAANAEQSYSSCDFCETHCYIFYCLFLVAVCVFFFFLCRVIKAQVNSSVWGNALCCFHT